CRDDGLPGGDRRPYQQSRGNGGPRQHGGPVPLGELAHLVNHRRRPSQDGLAAQGALDVLGETPPRVVAAGAGLLPTPPHPPPPAARPPLRPPPAAPAPAAAPPPR